MIQRTLYLLTLTLMISILSGANYKNRDVEVYGKTYKLKLAGKDKYKYIEVPGVEVVVLRNTPVNKRPIISDSKGEFHFKIPYGSPFDVTFHLYPGNVPKLNQLAGINQLNPNFIHITLMTKNQIAAMTKGNLQIINNQLDLVINKLSLVKEEILYSNVDNNKLNELLERAQNLKNELN